MYIQENKNFKIYNSSGDQGVKSSREYSNCKYISDQYCIVSFFKEMISKIEGRKRQKYDNSRRHQ